MKLALNHEMESIDKYIIEQMGIPSIVLMENAGRIVADEIQSDFCHLKKVLIICGMGNNGGDGFVIARYLYESGINVHVITIGQTKNMRDDAVINFEIIKKMDIPIHHINDISGVSKLEKILPLQDVVVDALFGTGLSRVVEGFFEKVILAVNNLSSFVYSVDIPSGVDSNSGKIMGISIQADKTITYIYPKIGNIMYPAADKCGELVVKNIGLSTEFIPSGDMKHNLITEELACELLPHRPKNSHKGTYGTACVIAGSMGMTGAAILTSKAALRCGIGLLKLYIPESLHHLITTSIPEAVIVPLVEMRRGVIAITQMDVIMQGINGAKVVAIGPGCGVSGEMLELLRRLIKELEKPIVIDADGLNVLAKNVDILLDSNSDIVITPHPGEMARLLDVTIDEVIEKPIEIASEFAKKYGVVVVLKGARTVVADKSGTIYVNVTGNTGMATGGTGDVLTGIITGFIAQGLYVTDAAVLAVYIHGLAGDKIMESKGEYGLLASDVVEGLPYAFRQLETKIDKTTARGINR